MKMESVRIQACIINCLQLWEEIVDIPGISFRIKLIQNSWCCLEGVNELVMK